VDAQRAAAAEAAGAGVAGVAAEGAHAGGAAQLAQRAVGAAVALRALTGGEVAVGAGQAAVVARPHADAVGGLFAAHLAHGAVAVLAAGAVVGAGGAGAVWGAGEVVAHAGVGRGQHGEVDAHLRARLELRGGAAAAGDDGAGLVAVGGE